MLNIKKIILGSHVSMNAPQYFLGSVQEALSYNANALMIYTGPPQSTIRKPINELKILEAQKLWINKGYNMDNFIIHAPYIINLASIDEKKRNFGIQFLINEIKRCNAFKAKYIILHPGSSVNTNPNISINLLSQSLNEVLSKTRNIIICLETMSGKGNEIGHSFKQLKQIIEKIKLQSRIGICFDTCHLHDAGYDLHNFDKILIEFEKYLNLDKIKVIHFNDSLNPMGSHKDRHANFGKGYIGDKNLIKIITNHKVTHLPFILETPYINKKPPYKKEIQEILKKIEIFYDK